MDPNPILCAVRFSQFDVTGHVGVCCVPRLDDQSTETQDSNRRRTLRWMTNGTRNETFALVALHTKHSAYKAKSLDEEGILSTCGGV